MTSDIEGLKPTAVHSDADGRIMVADSLSYFEHEPWLDTVAVGASFAGAPTAAMCMRMGVKGWIAHEGGPGKDNAGIGGLPLADSFGVAAAAIATREARLSGGRSLLTGHVSACNDSAKKLGVRPGMTGEQAAHLMLKAPSGALRKIDDLIDESTHTMLSSDSGSIYACWSFSRVRGPHPRDVFCVASHGAKIMALYALRAAPKGVICNDAGFGLDNSGVEGLDILEEHGILGATVSTDSARIGDALSTYHDGIISAVNARARRCGVEIGMAARDAARLMLEG